MALRTTRKILNNQLNKVNRLLNFDYAIERRNNIYYMDQISTGASILRAKTKGELWHLIEAFYDGAKAAQRVLE